MKELTLLIAEEFSPTPGPRYDTQGPSSGEKFLKHWLQPKFDEAVKAGATLLVDLDGTEGYATSFLEEAFGGLARSRGAEAVRATLRLKTLDEPYLEEEVWEYVDDALVSKGANKKHRKKA
jgi:hypothetical protein